MIESLNNKPKASPGYAKIKRQLLSEIRRGHWKVNDVIPSEHALRARFGVSRATVVRSLNELVLGGYLYRKRGKGTYVAEYRSNERTLPLFVELGTFKLAGTARQTLLRIMSGIADGLGPRHPGFTVKPLPVELDDASRQAIDELKPQIALCIEPGFMKGLVEHLQKVGCIVWAINEPTDNCNCVYIDQEAAAYIATKHLLKCGRRKIALLNGLVDVYWGFAAKQRGYERALREAGVAIDPRLHRQAHEATDSEAGRRMVREMLADGIDFDGIVAASDPKGIGALSQAREAGRIIKQDFSIITIDNNIADQADPPLSAVELPLQDVGKQAVSRALESEASGDGAKLIQKLCLQPTLIDRGS
jgi:GntR family transcriptional regulator of arabinose operon